jgi:hypothetical protein
MKYEFSTNDGWDEWRDILLFGYEQGLSFIHGRGAQASSTRRAFTAIFLQTKGLRLPPVDILSEAMRIIREKDANDPAFDSLALLGHRIGIIESPMELVVYFRDLNNSLKPNGQVLITSINVMLDTSKRQRSALENELQQSRRYGDILVQRENLVGPFFSTMRLKFANLHKQTEATDWIVDVLHYLDEDNFVVQLSATSST